MSLTSEIIRIVNRVLASAKKITELPDSGALIGNEYAEIAKGGSSVKATLQQIANLAPGAVSGALSYKGIYDLSTDFFPGSAQIGYCYFSPNASSSLLAHDGEPIAEGSFLISKINGASTTDYNDWIIINTQW